MKREIGSTKTFVHPIGLGAMPLSLDRRPREEDAIRVIHAAVEAGIDFIDTADVYCIDDNDIGHNERLVARALATASRSNVYVATKGGCTRPGGRWERDGTPKHLRQACEQSLRSLNVSRIFLYQLHAVDPNVPLEKSVGELLRLQLEGKIEHIGLSNVSPPQLSTALRLGRIETVQNRFNPFEKQDLRSGMVELCRQHEITFIPHSPMGGHFSHSERAHHPVITEIAVAHGASPYQIILAWHLGLAPHILPIPGASRISSAVDSSQAVSVTLSPEERARIDALV